MYNGSSGLTPLKYICVEFFDSTVSGANAGGDVRIPTGNRPFFFHCLQTLCNSPKNYNNTCVIIMTTEN